MGSDNITFSGYEHGSARFAESFEIRESTTQINLTEKCGCGGLPLYSDGGDILWVDGKDTNSLIVSSTGGGKSRRICTPILLSDIAAGYSLVVTDPKAELLKSSYDFLKRHGYNIKIINFRDPQNSNRWNPLYRGASMYKERPDLAAEAFCEVGHCIYQHIHSEKDPFWEISAENIFAGIALMACEHVVPEQVTLGLVYRMFIDGEKRLGGTTYLNEYLSECKNPMLEQALSGISSAPHETRASIGSVVSSQLSKLVINRSIDEMLTGKSFLADDFVNKKSLSEAEIATRISPNAILNIIGGGSFSFDVVHDEAANDFIDLYMENREVYDKGPCLNYEMNRGKDKGYFSMDLATQQIGLSFVSGEKVNYFFFQGDTVSGMSGDCDRRVAININDRINNILIPYSVVDRYKVYKDSMKLKKAKE